MKRNKKTTEEISSFLSIMRKTSSPSSPNLPSIPQLPKPLSLPQHPIPTTREEDVTGEEDTHNSMEENLSIEEVCGPTGGRKRGREEEEGEKEEMKMMIKEEDERKEDEEKVEEKEERKKENEDEEYTNRPDVKSQYSTVLYCTVQHSTVL